MTNDTMTKECPMTNDKTPRANIARLVIGHSSAAPISVMSPNPPNQDGSDSLVELIAHAQHDLRNPLGNILGFCEILGQQLRDAPNQELRDGLETISQWAEQMAKEIDHVLDPN